MKNSIVSLFCFLSVLLGDYCSAQTAIPNEGCSTALTLTNVTNYCSPSAGYTNVGSIPGSTVATSSGTTTSTTPTASCWTGNPQEDVWFSFTATGTDLLISVSGSGSGGGTIVRPRIALYTGSCTGTLNELGCADGSATSNISQIYKGGLVLGQTYLIRVSTTNANEGTFELCVNNYNPPLSASADCGGAGKLCNKNSISVPSLSGGGSNVNEPEMASCMYNPFGTFGAAEANSVWYTWTCGTSGTLLFDLIPTDPTNDLDFTLYQLSTTNPCGTRSVLRCSAAACLGTTGATGLNATDPDISETSGLNCTGTRNGYCSQVNMTAGTSYAILINNANGNTAFTINWGGTGTFQGPDANIVSTSTTVCAGSSINFNGSTSTNYTTLDWTFNSTGSPVSYTGVGPHSIVFPTAGNYSAILKATQAGCSSIESQNILVLANPTVTVNSPTICAGSSVVLTASGATNYTWSPATGLSGVNIANPTANPSSTTIYTITGAAGTCTGSTTSTLTVNPNPTVTVNSATVCAGVSATLTANGATNYTWSPSGTLSSSTGSTVIANSVAQTYTVLGATGSCTNTSTAVVTIASALSISANSPTICSGTSKVLTATGATNYTWSPSGSLSSANGNTVTANPLTTTIYTITGTAGGCSGVGTTTVTVTPNPTVTVNSGIICSGSSLTLTATGATNYTWSPATTLSSPNGSVVTANPLSTTQYTVTGSTGTCTNSAVSNVTVIPTPTITATSGTICSGSSVVLTANGATSYSWSPSSTLSSAIGNTVTANPSITTSYTVTGANGSCTNTVSTTVSVTAIPTISVNSQTICPTVSATLIATGATNYTWSPTATLNTSTGSTVIASPVTTTTYTIVGANGTCTNSATSVVTMAPSLILSVNTATICAGSSTVLVASGAVNYTWSPAMGLSSANGSTVTANPGTTTTYTINGETGGCSGVTITTVTVISNPTIAVASATICAGSNTILNANGATNYTWAPAASLSSVTGNTVTANPTATQEYTITGEAASCTSTTTATVFVNPIPVIIVPSATICIGASVNLNANGATNYTWAPAASLDASTGASVIATPGATQEYTITGESALCIGSITATVTVNALPVITAGPNATICPGISTTLTATGGQNYNWLPTGSLSSFTGSVVIASPVSNTIYTVTGVDANGCSNTNTVSVDMGGTLSINISPDATVCPGSSSTFTASGATTYSWTPNTFLDNNNTATVITTPDATTTYTVNGASGVCTGSNVVTIVVQNTVVVNASATNTIICPSGSTTLSASGATSYVWSPAGTLSPSSGTTVVATPQTTQTYTVIGATGTCTNSAEVVITVTTNPVITATDQSICSGSSVGLSASGASTYTWSPATGLSGVNLANPTANPSSSQLYTVSGTSPLGCISFTNVQVTVVPLPVLTVSSTASPICVGSSVTLTAGGATTYTWSPATLVANSNAASTVATPINTTLFTVGGSNGTSPGPVCTSSQTIEIIVQPITVPVPDPAPDMCYGDYSVVSATGGTSYTWSPAASLDVQFNASATARPAVTTIYTVTATQNGMCPGTATVEVIVHPLPVVNAGPDTTINIDEAVVLNGIANADAGFISEDGSTLACNFCMQLMVNPQESTCYLLKGVSAYGCVSYDEVCVEVTKDWAIYIPNAFTPNGDNVNDLFFAKAYGIEEMQMTIFNRWGELLFTSDDPKTGWDGKNKGVQVQEGVYTYLVEAKTMGGKYVNKTGHITVLPRLK